MATDPGDLVLDPTCGSGTTAYVAEQWGRRWITIDTSRVALALARARIMGARYPYYLLADSPEGLRKEAEVSGRAFADRADTRQRPPRLRLRARAAHHAEVDRQQRGDRRHLRRASAEGPGRARPAERGAARPQDAVPRDDGRTRRQGRPLRRASRRDVHDAERRGRLGICARRVGGPASESAGGLAGGSAEATRRLLGGAHRAAEGDRRLDREQGGVRVSLRPAVRRIRRPSASPDRSPSRASARTARSAWTRTTS